jgi:hypothetical protein
MKSPVETSKLVGRRNHDVLRVHPHPTISYAQVNPFHIVLSTDSYSSTVSILPRNVLKSDHMCCKRTSLDALSLSLITFDDNFWSIPTEEKTMVKKRCDRTQ